MGKSKDLATLKDSGLSIDGALTTTSTGTNLTSNSYNVVKIQTDKDDNGSNDDAILQFTTGSSNTVKGELRYDESESMFEIGHGDNQGHIRIDSSGRVTTPSNPYFWAQAANVGASDYSGGSIIFIGGAVNSGTLDNTGSHFSTSTGRFTAPVSGVYHFSAVVRIDSFGGSYSYLSLWDSGSVAFVRDLTSITTTYYTHTVAASRYLSANDYVYCHFTTAGDTSTTISSDSYFSGHLVG